MLVITDDGDKIGPISKEEAIKMAKDIGLDLFLVSPNSSPAVAKIVDYGHLKYEREKKQKEARKSGRHSNVKKVLKFSLKIGEHDYDVRVKHGIQFLEKGFRVQATVIFRGREMSHRELGVALLERIIKDLEEYGAVESRANGARDLSAVLVPLKKGDSNAKK